MIIVKIAVTLQADLKKWRMAQRPFAEFLFVCAEGREYLFISADFRLLLEILDFVEITITTNITKLSLDFHRIYKLLATF